MLRIFFIKKNKTKNCPDNLNIYTTWDYHWLVQVEWLKFCLKFYLASVATPCNLQKQSCRGVLIKKYSEDMQQVYWIYPCRSAISIKLRSNFFKIAVWHGCSPVKVLHVFRTPFPKNTSGGLLLNLIPSNAIHVK